MGTDSIPAGFLLKGALCTVGYPGGLHVQPGPCGSRSLSAGGLGHEGDASSVPAGSESRPEASQSQFCSEHAALSRQK